MRYRVLETAHRAAEKLFPYFKESSTCHQWNPKADVAQFPHTVIHIVSKDYVSFLVKRAGIDVMATYRKSNLKRLYEKDKEPGGRRI